MNLLAVSTDELKLLPLQGVAAVCLRAAMRVRPLTTADCDMSLILANKVLQGSEPPCALYEPVETLYQMAARATAEYRTTKRDDIRRISTAGVVIQSAVDCIADIKDDPQAALTNGMLTLRACGKLRDLDLSHQVTHDLSYLETKFSREPNLTDPTQEFGPLWSNQPPVWYRL